MIRECEAEAALDIFEQAFDLTDEEKEAVLRQRLAIWTRSNSIDRSLLESWSDSQRLRFASKWADDSIMMPTEPAECQTEGKRPVDEESMESAAKRPRAEEYFTVKSVKQVNVRKFRTTGTDLSFILYYL